MSQKVDAAIQMAVGAAVVGLCGSCTLNLQSTGWSSVALVVGGGPTIIGLVVFILGLLRWRRSEGPRDGVDRK